MENQSILDVAESGALAWAHPLVRTWFLEKFGTPTEPQELGWPPILENRSALICAPTGSGKTLAAFLACIDRLVRKANRGELLDTKEVLYISPLKALGNDIQRKLNVPLAEILGLAQQQGSLMPEIRTAVRTGDTLARERLAMQKRPPHILVTTPESLYILLTAGNIKRLGRRQDRKSTRLNSSHTVISYAVFCLKKKNHCKCKMTVHAKSECTVSAR